MDEESGNSATPTALMKIFGDFDTRVKTASRRTGDAFEGFRPGSLLSSNIKLDEGSLLGRKASSSSLRGRLVFEDQDSPQNQAKRQKRTSGAVDDPLDGLDRYPKARRTDDTKSSTAEIERMKMQLIQKDADIVSLEADVKQAEAKIKKMEVELAKDRIKRESERESHIRQLRIEQERNDDLKHKIRKLSERSGYEKEYSESRPDINTSIENNFEQVDKLMDEVECLKEELFAVKSEFDDKENRYKEEILMLQSSNNELNDQMDALKNAQTSGDPSDLKSELERSNGEYSVALQKIKQLESQIQSTEDDRIQFKIMKKKLDHFHDLEKEVSKLRNENKLLTETQDNSRLLQEQIDQLQKSLSRSEDLLSESRKKHEELLFIERTLKQWKGICWKLLESSEKEKYGYDNLGPDLLEGKIAGLQQQALSLAEDVESLKSQCAQKERNVQNLDEEQNELKQKIQSDKDNLTEQANLIKRFKRKLLLVSKERDSYKSVLGSYEQELTFNGAAFEKDRVTAVESSLAHYKDTVENLENLLAAAQSNKPSDTETKLRAEIARLEEVVRQTAQLQGQPDVPPDCKILHFSNNPLAQATEERKHEVENLRAEIVSLKARINLLEEGQTKDLTLLVGQKLEEGPSSEEVRKLQEQLQSLEIKKQRLMEAFKKTSQDFREVCYVLTGYRIDGLNDGKYRLSPVYADSPNDFLLFQRDNNSGDCHLLETELMKQDHIQQLYQLHLEEQHSIPMFLAAVISDMFSRQTFVSGMGEPSVSGIVHSMPDDEEDVRDEEEAVEEEEVLEEVDDVVEGDESDEVSDEEEEEMEEEDEDGNDPLNEENEGQDSSSSSDIVCID